MTHYSAFISIMLKRCFSESLVKLKYMLAGEIQVIVPTVNYDSATGNHYFVIEANGVKHLVTVSPILEKTIEQDLNDELTDTANKPVKNRMEKFL